MWPASPLQLPRWGRACHPPLVTGDGALQPPGRPAVGFQNCVRRPALLGPLQSQLTSVAPWAQDQDPRLGSRQHSWGALGGPGQPCGGGADASSVQGASGDSPGRGPGAFMSSPFMSSLEAVAAEHSGPGGSKVGGCRSYPLRWGRHVGAVCPMGEEGRVGQRERPERGAEESVGEARRLRGASRGVSPGLIGEGGAPPRSGCGPGSH